MRRMHDRKSFKPLSELSETVLRTLPVIFDLRMSGMRSARERHATHARP
jgi:hypothetical protein